MEVTSLSSSSRQAERYPKVYDNDFELPEMDLGEQTLVKKMDYITPLMQYRPVKVPKKIRYFEQTLSSIEYVQSIVQLNRFCVAFATTSHQVANLDASLKSLMKGEAKAVRERTNDDCPCQRNNLPNVYARIVQLYIKRISGIEELKRLNQQDLMRQIQFCFCRFIAFNTAYFNWKEAMYGEFHGTLYKKMESLVEQEHLDAAHNDIDDLLPNDEEYEMLNTILFFTAGANLSPEGQAHLQVTKKAYIAVLTEYINETYTPDFSATDVLIRNYQLLEVIGNIEEMSEAMNRSLVLAAAFDFSHMRGNLTYDLHLREF